MAKRSAIERFMEKVAVDPETGCWLWTGSLDRGGYATFWADRSVHAHRWSYEHLVGPIPDGLELDHACHGADLSCSGGDACPHRRCVNPDHLDPVTPLENVRRSVRGRPGGACSNGHARSMYGYRGSPRSRADGSVVRWWKCRECDRDHRATYKQRQTP